MEHLAIMRKSWNLTNKILTGEKKIESRWYKNKYVPWNKIKETQKNGIYYLKNKERIKLKYKLRYHELKQKKFALDTVKNNGFKAYNAVFQITFPLPQLLLKLF